MKGGVNFVRAVSHVLVWILLAQFRPGPIIDFAIVSLFVCLQVFAVDFEFYPETGFIFMYLNQVRIEKSESLNFGQ